MAIAFFFIFLAVTLGITWWAASRTRTAAHFYTAGGSVTAFQNGLALAGDYMSAASFLGIAGMVATSGFDGLIYSIGFLVGWPIVTFLIAEPLRNLGKYTFADVVAYRLSGPPVRMAAALGTLAVVSFYLIAQMVGAGNLIHLLFGIRYETAVVVVGDRDAGVRALRRHDRDHLGADREGGAPARRGASILAGLVLCRFHLNPLDALRRGGDALRRRRPGAGQAGEQPARRGLAGPRADVRHRRAAPHPDALLHRARRAHGARLRQLRDRVHRVLLPADVHPGLRRDGAGRPRDASSRSTRAGTWRRRCWRPWWAAPAFLGFISAVAFATILAVVAGLTLSGAAALSHDIWVNVVRHGEAPEREQLRVARGATVLLAVSSIALGIAFKGQNVAYMVGLAFAIAASANFPALVLSDVLAALHHARRAGQHDRGHAVGAAADRAVADDPGRDAGQCAGDRSR